MKFPIAFALSLALGLAFLPSDFTYGRGAGGGGVEVEVARQEAEEGVVDLVVENGEEVLEEVNEVESAAEGLVEVSGVEGSAEVSPAARANSIAGDREAPAGRRVAIS